MATVRMTNRRWTTRTVAGVELHIGEHAGQVEWVGVIEGEEWHFFEEGRTLAKRPFTKRWQGYTADHLTGARSVSLTKLVTWVLEHRAEWRAKLRVRRGAGTRMVDPAA